MSATIFNKGELSGGHLSRQHLSWLFFFSWQNLSHFNNTLLIYLSKMVKIVKTPTQPELNKSWVWHVTDLIWTKLQRKLYGSIFNRYLPSPWLLSREHFFWGQLSISVITQLLLNQFWPNFKVRFLVPSITDANWHGNICSVNICPDNNCPYQHNLSCYWPDFDQTFWIQIFGVLIFVDQYFFDPKVESCAQHYSPILQPPTHPPKYTPKYPPNHPPTAKVVNLVHLLDLYNYLISSFNC